MNLVFQHRGKLRQGHEFTQYSTGDVAHPVIYVSEDGEEVLLVSRAETGAFSIRELTRKQWMQSRVKYALIDPSFEPPIKTESRVFQQKSLVGN